MINRDTIVKLAREAGLPIQIFQLERFAALVAAAEREACAQICDRYDRKHDRPEVRWCAEDIRARSQQA